MTQVERIDRYIKDFGSITRAEAMIDLGIANFGARYSEMKDYYPIKSVWEHGKNRYGEAVSWKRYYYDENAIQERDSVRNG